MAWAVVLVFGVKPAGRELLHRASVHFLPGPACLCCPGSLPELRVCLKVCILLRIKKMQVL